MDKKILEEIKKYLKIINPNISKIEKDNTEIVDFAIEEVLDRVQLYLNSETIPSKLERILAKIVNNGLKKCLKDIELSKKNVTNLDQVITTISDNGQSISYANEITKYFSTASDEELFTGFATLLSRYRRIKVVNSRHDEREDS